MQTQTVPTKIKQTKETRQLHKYVLICVGVWLLFVATFPLAYLRVSRNEKYAGTPFKSLTWEESQKTSPSSTK